ncbi:YgjV family protein [Rhodoferax sp.]|uniref:YgjV family protein n=1 Tax=Rhodoferax sp. TaxID=50421 RepID=UPI00277626E0|nr:YgjV family protein [Rhodoferax sp.]
MGAADIVGVLACLVVIGALTFKNDHRFKLVGLIAILLWVLYYWLLGAASGFVFMLLLAVRQVISLFAERLSSRTRQWALIALVVAMTASAAFTWEGLQSLLPWVAAVNGAHAYSVRSGIMLRSQLFLGDCAWLAYAVIVQAWPHVVLMLIVICVNLVTIHRLRREIRSLRGV